MGLISIHNPFGKCFFFLRILAKLLYIQPNTNSALLLGMHVPNKLAYKCNLLDIPSHQQIKFLPNLIIVIDTIMGSSQFLLVNLSYTYFFLIILHAHQVKTLVCASTQLVSHTPSRFKTGVRTNSGCIKSPCNPPQNWTPYMKL